MGAAMRFAALALAWALPAFANAEWRVERIDAAGVPAEIVPDSRPFASNGIPGGRIAMASTGGIARAWYVDPTRRYRHAVLGDDIEAGGVRVETDAGAVLTYELPQSEVFEDLTPRLADLDGDGATEVITIVSGAGDGAGLAVFGLIDGALEKLAEGPKIGRANRWLNIAGIDRFAGRSTPEVALVVTPHIGGRLEFFRYSGGRLLRLAHANGFSNHVIGSPEQRLSAVVRYSHEFPRALAVPSRSRDALIIVALTSAGIKELERIDLPGRIDKAIGVTGAGDGLILTVGLADGSVYALSR